jgi:hypothetical protein
MRRRDQVGDTSERGMSQQSIIDGVKGMIFLRQIDFFVVNRTLALKETSNNTKHLKKNKKYNEI